jgi:hypothetical protein
MNNSGVIRLLVFVLVVNFILPLPVLADSVGKFRDVQGNVSVTRVKADSKAKTGDDVRLNDLVSTREKSRTKIALSDDTLLTLGQNSKLEITRYLFSPQKKASTISLKMGTLHSQIQKTVDSSFEVRTPNAIAGARGTVWLSVVEVVNGVLQTNIYVLEGTVTVFNAAVPGQIVTLAAGQFTTVIGSLAPALPAAFSPAVVQGIMGQLGITSVEAIGAAAGSAITTGVTAGTVSVGIAIGTGIVGAAIAVGSSSGSSSDTTTTHTTTSHH